MVDQQNSSRELHCDRITLVEIQSGEEKYLSFPWRMGKDKRMIIKRYANEFKDFIEINSSAIWGVVYHAKKRELEVYFTNGDSRIYLGVPRKTVEEFLESPSKGGYFNFNIRDNYPFR